jgi:ABC-type transporter Mla subunit MlaD
MSASKPNYFAIGLFIVAGLAILTGGLIAFGAGQIFRPRIYIETYLDGTVQGIDVGSPVKFRGVQIGKVSQISFSFNDYGPIDRVNRHSYVVILMEIDKEMFPGMFTENLEPLIKKNVEQGLRARIEPLGITGMNYIELNYLKDPSQFPMLTFDWKPEHYYIPSAPGQLTNILDSVNTIMAEMKQLNLGEMQGGLNNLLANLNKAVTDADLEKVSQDLQALIGQVKTAVADANLQKVSQDLQALIESMKQAVADAKIPELSGDAHALLAGLEKSNTDIQKILRNLEPATRLKPGEIQGILNDLSVTAANLEATSTAVKQRPSVLIWGSPPKPKPSPTPRDRGQEPRGKKRG